MFFRALDFSTAWEMVRAMVGFGTAVAGQTPSHVRAIVCLCVIAGMLFAHVRWRNTHIEDVLAGMTPTRRGLLLGAFLVMIATMGGAQRAFIYFQF